MVLEFPLARPTSCEARGPVYALCDTVDGWRSTHRMDQVYLGNEAPDIDNPKLILIDVIDTLVGKGEPLRDVQGILTAQVVKLCTSGHDSPPLRSKLAEPISERVVDIVVPGEGQRPFAVEVEKHRGVTEVSLKLPLESYNVSDIHYSGVSVPPTGIIKPLVLLEVTAEERASLPIVKAVRGPYTNNQRLIGFVGLRGGERLVDMSNPDEAYYRI